MISSSLDYHSGIHFSSPVTIRCKKPFRLCLQHFTCEKSVVNISRLQFIWNPISLLLNHSTMINDFKRYEIVESLLM